MLPCIAPRLDYTMDSSQEIPYHFLRFVRASIVFEYSGSPQSIEHIVLQEVQLLVVCHKLQLKHMLPTRSQSSRLTFIVSNRASKSATS